MSFTDDELLAVARVVWPEKRCREPETCNGSCRRYPACCE